MPIVEWSASRQRPSLRLLVVASLLCVGGCGLADYEKRIDDQKAYLQLVDEENELLGTPLEMPTRAVKDDKGILRMIAPLQVEFFLRPINVFATKYNLVEVETKLGTTVSKGISSKYKADDPPFTYEGLPIFRYEGPKGFNVLATTAFVAPDKKDSRQLPAGALKVKDFQQRVRGALADYFQKQSGRVVSWLSPEHEKTKPDTRTIPNPRGKPTQITFDKQDLAEQADKKSGSLFHLYFTSTPLQQGAIIFQVPAAKSDDAILKRAIHLSVNSYGLALDALKKRADYRRMRKM